jgi:DNA-binding transcriptional ArsR family regulator
VTGGKGFDFMNLGLLAKLFKAISDETRQKILILLEKREMCVNDLVKEFDLSQPAISQHLNVLKNAGLVVDKRKGQKVLYSLNAERLKSGCGDFFGNFNCCCGLVIKTRAKKGGEKSGKGS